MSAILRFGPFELDPDREDLRRSGLDLRLHGQPLQILLLLLDRAGQVVTREEIQTAVWGDETHVGFEQGINTAIRQIRAVLNDNAEAPRYVRTIPRRGYVFIAPVERIVSPESGGPESAVPVVAAVVAPAAPPGRKRRARRSAAAVTIAAVMAIVLASSFAAILAAWRHRGAVTIAVSPFRAIGTKSTGVDARAFAEELEAAIALLPERHVRLITDGRADIVIEGTVQRTAEGLRVIASAIDSRSDLQLWSETYERPAEWTDGIAIETAHRVELAIAQRYLPPPKRAPSLVTRVRPRALELYRLAREQQDHDPIAAARSFEQALAAEPRFAEALSGLSDLAGERMLRSRPPERNREARRAADYARRAIELQPKNAEAWSIRGLVALQYDYDLAAAEAAFRRAIDGDTDYAVAHFNLAATLTARGRFDEALTEYSAARQLDPARFGLHPMEARIYLCARRYDDALARYRESRAVSREDTALILGQIAAYAAQHRWRDAITATQSLAELKDLPKDIVPATEDGFLQAYRKFEPFIREGCRNGTFNDYVGAAYYAELGDRERALEWLRISIASHAPSVSYALVDPRLDSLRDDPRFHALLRATKLGTRQDG
jgi:DNA-binding winged helix-turn-helix (wHTH) protein/tetratricopeptide (TPR) repeat protein